MSRTDLNTKTKWGGWAKAVLMQEADLPTVADCCTAAALLEDSVAKLTAERDRAVAAAAMLREALNEAADAWPRPNKYDALMARAPLAEAALAVIEASDALVEAARPKGARRTVPELEALIAAKDALDALRLAAESERRA